MSFLICLAKRLGQTGLAKAVIELLQKEPDSLADPRAVYSNALALCIDHFQLKDSDARLVAREVANKLNVPAKVQRAPQPSRSNWDSMGRYTGPFEYTPRLIKELKALGKSWALDNMAEDGSLTEDVCYDLARSIITSKDENFIAGCADYVNDGIQEAKKQKQDDDRKNWWRSGQKEEDFPANPELTPKEYHTGQQVIFLKNIGNLGPTEISGRIRTIKDSVYWISDSGGGIHQCRKEDLKRKISGQADSDFPKKLVWPPLVGDRVIAKIFKSDDDGDTISDEYEIIAKVLKIKNTQFGPDFFIEDSDGEKHHCDLENLRARDTDPTTYWEGKRRGQADEEFPFDPKCKRLECSSCGGECFGNQWSNRDTGYGICNTCADRILGLWQERAARGGWYDDYSPERAFVKDYGHKHVHWGFPDRVGQSEEEFPQLPKPKSKFSFSAGDVVQGPFGLARIKEIHDPTGDCIGGVAKLEQLQDWEDGDSIFKCGSIFTATTTQLRHAQKETSFPNEPLAIGDKVVVIEPHNRVGIIKQILADPTEKFSTPYFIQYEDNQHITWEPFSNLKRTAQKEESFPNDSPRVVIYVHQRIDSNQGFYLGDRPGVITQFKGKARRFDTLTEAKNYANNFGIHNLIDSPYDVRFIRAQKEESFPNDPIDWSELTTSEKVALDWAPGFAPSDRCWRFRRSSYLLIQDSDGFTLIDEPDPTPMEVPAENPHDAQDICKRYLLKQNQNGTRRAQAEIGEIEENPYPKGGKVWLYDAKNDILIPGRIHSNDNLSGYHLVEIPTNLAGAAYHRSDFRPVENPLDWEIEWKEGRKRWMNHASDTVSTTPWGMAE